MLIFILRSQHNKALIKSERLNIFFFFPDAGKPQQLDCSVDCNKTLGKASISVIYPLCEEPAGNEKLQMEITIERRNRIQSPERPLWFSSRSNAFDSHAYTGLYLQSAVRVALLAFCCIWQQTTTQHLSFLPQQSIACRWMKRWTCCFWCRIYKVYWMVTRGIKNPFAAGIKW